MPSNSSVLALFSPKPPVEPTEPKVDRRSEVDFNDFLSNATHQVERSPKPSPGNSTKNNKRDEIGNREKIKPKIKNGKEKPVATKDKPVIKEKLKTKDNEYAKTATKIENTTVTKTETTATDSALKQNDTPITKLKELGINQDEFEALLEYLGLNGEVSFESLLKALTQNINQNSLTAGKDIDSFSQNKLLAQLLKNEGENTNITQNKLLAQLLKNEGENTNITQNKLLAQLLKNEGENTNITQNKLLAQLLKNEGEAIHTLKKAGLTDEQAKNLIDQLKTTSANTASITLQTLGKDIDSTSQIAILDKLQKNEVEVFHTLKKAGLTDEQAKNLIDQLKTTSANTTSIAAQKETDTTRELNIKKDIQPQQIETAKNETTKQVDQSGLFKHTEPKEKTNEPAVYVQPKDVSKKIEKSERAASLDKILETKKPVETTNKTTSELKGNQGTKTSNNFNQVLQDNNAQAKLVQIEGAKDTGNFKGLESAKSGPDLQTQVSNSAAENAIKQTEANKSVLPEKLVARGTSETKIISQIINKLNVRTTGTQNEVHVKLDPPSLGTVRLNITTVGESVRTVIVAENHAVKQTIENNFNQLRDAMNDQGLKVDSFSVTVGGDSGNSNQNGKQLGEKDTTNPLNRPQTAPSDNGDEFEEARVPFIFDENQSISVLA
ncbi:MAG: flagellar hook-length control protein FliK [Nitrospinota bacterium]|nr:flagellar hook-length control protein FliK [Nitrospinota bacterium]